MVERPEWRGRLFSGTNFRLRVPPSAQGALRVNYGACSKPIRGVDGKLVPLPWDDGMQGEARERRMCYSWRLAARLTQRQLDEMLECPVDVSQSGMRAFSFFMLNRIEPY
jgi:hypothetical protein